jgi:hypothetical protein
VSIEPETSSVYNGDVFTVDLMVEGVEDLAGYEFSVAFDSDIVEVDGVVDGGFLGSTGRDPVPFPPDIDNEAGLLTFAAATMGTGPGPDGEGKLAVITLEAAGLGTSGLDLHEVTLFDTGGGGHEPTTVDDGTVEVLGSPPNIPSDPLLFEGVVHQSAFVDLSWTGGVPDASRATALSWSKLSHRPSREQP